MKRWLMCGLMMAGANALSGTGTLYVDANTVNADGTGATIVPVGFIGLWSGGISTNFDATGKGTNCVTHTLGWALCNGQNGTPDLRSAFVKGIGDGEEVGGTGGAATHAPAGALSSDSAGTPSGAITITNSTTGLSIADHTMSGSTATESSHTHSVTAAGTVTITNTTDTGTVAWPAGAPTFTGTAPNTTNAQTIAAGSTARLVATNAAATPAGTVAWPAGVPTFSGVSHGHTNSFAGSVVTSGAGSAHSHAAGTLAPSSHSITDNGHTHTNHFTGAALATHTHTFTGTSANTEPAYVKLAYIQKQ